MVNKRFNEIVANSFPIYSDTVTKEWNGVEIEIKPVLSITEVTAFVKDVTIYCFTGDKYSPELKDLGIRLSVIKYYTNISMPESISEEDIMNLYKYDIVDFVLNEINMIQFDKMIQSIDDGISNILNRNGTLVGSKFTELIDTAIGIVKVVSDKIAEIGDENILEFINAFRNIGEETKEDNESTDNMEEHEYREEDRKISS